MEARVVAPREPQYLSPVRMTVEVVVKYESLHVATVGVHHVDLEVPVAGRVEDNLLTVGRPVIFDAIQFFLPH